MKENSAHYEFSLTNQFFADIDAPEIQKGKLQVQLDVKKTMGIYVLNFHIEGSVVVPCDRCLDDMELPVETDDTLMWYSEGKKVHNCLPESTLLRETRNRCI